jgi:ABC-type phosphate transport system substrate-binding protein
MKKHLIAAAIGAMGLASTSAHALNFTTNPTPDYVVYAGGGSAQANALYVAANQVLSSVDSYTDDTNCNESGTWRIIYGAAKANAIKDGTTTIASGKAVLFMYRFAGGTFTNGIGTVATGGNLAYPTVTNISSATSCGAAPHPTFKFVLGSTTTSIPDFGVSDEEVALFNSSRNVPGSYTSVTGGGGLQAFHPGTVLTTAQVNNLSQSSLYTNLVGIAVTTTVSAGTHPKTNFTKAEITNILTGSISNWNQLYADDGTQLPAQTMILLDRAPGSGTKAAVSTYFLNSPGSLAEGGALTPINEVSTGGGPIGAVPTTTCSSSVPAATAAGLVDVNEGSSSALYKDLQALSGRSCMAIGILGLEFAPEGQGGNYQFVKINGADPYSRITSAGHTIATYANQINGTYDLMFDNSFNYRTTSINGGGYSGDHTYHSAFINTFLSTLSANTLPGGNSGAFPAGVAGALLDPAIDDFTLAGCVTTGTRFGNSLSPLQLFADATTGASLGCNDPLN